MGVLEQELAKYPSTRAGIVKYDDIDYYCPIPIAQLNVIRLWNKAMAINKLILKFRSMV